MAQNIREIINGYRDRITTSEDLKKDEASQMLIELSAYVGNINEEIVNRESSYWRAFKVILDQPKMGFEKAKVYANATTEYDNLNEAKRYLETTTEMIRTLKYRLRALDDEFGVAKNL